MKNIILFDSKCNLCNKFSRFVIKNDYKSIYKFIPFQSNFGKKIMLKQNFLPNKMTTIILLEKNKIYEKSTAVLKIFKNFKYPIHFLSKFLLLPVKLRDTIYMFVSKTRKIF